MIRRGIASALLMLAACRPNEDSGIIGTGTIELTQVEVAPFASGRVGRVWVEEGATVARGDTLVTLTVATLGADIDQRRARVAAAEGQLRDLQAGARPAEIGQRAAELRAAEAEATRTARELTRFTALAAGDAISQSRLDEVATAANVAAGRRDVARETLRLAREGARPDRVRSAQAEVAAARAALTMTEAAAGELVLTAPIAGTVLGRYAELGEVIAAGATVLTLGDATRPWMRVYLAAPMLPGVRVGQKVRATLDGGTAAEFTGRVVSVASEAEFTPRVALTENERADLLFGVKVEFADSTGTLKAGLPATARFEPAPSTQASPR